MSVRTSGWPAGAMTAAVVALAGAAVGCGGGGSSSGGGGSGGPKIAFLLPESKTTRYETQDRPDFIGKVRALCASCKVIYENAGQDAARQQQQAESALTEGAKVLVLDAVDVQAASAIVRRAKQENVPVISYGRLVANAPLAYYVSIDPYKVGQQQGRVLLNALSKAGKTKPAVVMINGSPTDSNAAPYKKGAHSVLDAAGVKVVSEYDTPDWSPDKAQQEMEQTITKVGPSGFDGVYVANDGMASGVVAAMKGARIDPKTRPMTGQDAELAAIQRILVGDQLMTVYQPIRKIADTAAELAVPLAQGKRPPAIAKDKVNNGAGSVPSVLLATIAITKSNIAQTVVKDGFLKASQICVGRYKQACASAGIS
jgi:D-xylose transport system substrate-binding protein